MSTATTTIGILGLGEAGRLYARGLAGAGARVRGFDPHHSVADAEIQQFDELGDVLAGADAVLSLVGGRAAIEVAVQALPLLAAGTVYADLNTAGPDAKQQIAGLARRADVPMADVAVLAPVPRAGHATPLLASGDGAVALATLLGPLGVPIDVVAGGAGEAARLRLLRSLFMKGLAALVLEGLGAARAAGAEDWLRAQMENELGPDGPALIDRLVDGTYAHAERREHEVRVTLEMLEASGQPSDMTRATLAWLERVVDARHTGR